MRNLRRVLKTQYKFGRSMLRKDAAADRKGITEGLDWVMRQADAAHKKGIKPTVVIAYSGHGGRQKEHVKGSEEDGQDESWIPSDGNNAGGLDIIDDDLGRVIMYLDSKGATVIRITDSCYSGTSHRGSDEHRAVRNSDVGINFADPPPSIFKDKNLPLMTEQAKPKLVHLAACQDNEKSWEGQDDQGRACGRFSLALIHELENSAAAMSWDELYRRLIAGMASRWPDEQSPKLSIDGGLESQQCFGQKPLPPYITTGKQTKNRIVINAGEFQSIAKGMRIEFFDGLQAMRDGKKLIVGGAPAVGKVVEVDLGHSVVELDRSDALPATAIAEMADARTPGFRLGTHGDLPKQVQTALNKLVEKNKIGLADKGFDVQMRWNEVGKSLLLYNPSGLPEDGANDQELAFVEFSYDDTDKLSRDLLKLGRRRALLACQRNERFLRVNLALGGGDATIEDPKARVQRIRVGSDGKAILKLTLESSYAAQTAILRDRLREVHADGRQQQQTPHAVHAARRYGGAERRSGFPANGTIERKPSEKQMKTWPGPSDPPDVANPVKGTSRMRLEGARRRRRGDAPPIRHRAFEETSASPTKQR